MSCIYGIFDNTNKCLYVGQTKRENPEETRWKVHQRDIINQKHKIKKLNTYNVEDLNFEVLCNVETDNSLVLATLENFYNSLLHPYNKCVIQGFRGNTVTLKREDNKELCEDIIELIKEYY